jgi:hypothetical protein
LPVVVLLVVGVLLVLPALRGIHNLLFLLLLELSLWGYE